MSATWSTATSGGEERSADVLIVTGDPTDAGPLADAIERSDRATEVRVIGVDEATREYARERDERSDDLLPNLVLLEGHRPGTTIEEFLEAFKSRDRLRPIPIIVVTDGTDPGTVARSYEQHANAAVPRPSDPDAADDLASAIGRFWLDAARLPPTD